MPLVARAAVLTGEAAVTIGAQGQGMVAGDLVNTASRLQGVAEPGTVLVGEATQRASSAAIAYEVVGDQALRGKALPVAAWRALRVVGRRGGQGRSEGLEAPFVGRDDELALLKDLYHSTVRERRARIVSITGQAGIGKSRLAWELLKYLDGLSELLYWHQGRSPAFGEGVSFWALGEMVRGRAGILEDDGPEATAEKLRAMLARVRAGRRRTARASSLPSARSSASRPGRTSGASSSGPGERSSSGWQRRPRGGARLRGHAVGRQRARRLRRGARDSLARAPDPGHHLGPTGVPRAAPDVGCRPSELHQPASRAARRRGHDGAARRASCPACRRRDAQGDPRSRRGRAALRRRDRAHAGRGWQPRARGRRISGRSAAGPALGARVAPGARRRASRCPGAAGSDAAPGRLGPRPELQRWPPWRA